MYTLKCFENIKFPYLSGVTKAETISKMWYVVLSEVKENIKMISIFYVHCTCSVGLKIV